MSNGKGDTPRPFSVDQETFANNWDRAFTTTPVEEKPTYPPTTIEELTREVQSIREKLMGDQNVTSE